MKYLKYTAAVLFTAAVVTVCAFLPGIAARIDEGRQTEWTEPIRELELDVADQQTQDLTGKIVTLYDENVHMLEIEQAKSLKIMNCVKKLTDGLADMGLSRAEIEDRMISYSKEFVYTQEKIDSGFFIWEARIDVGNLGRISYIIDDETGIMLGCELVKDKKQGLWLFAGALTDYSERLTQWFLKDLNVLGGELSESFGMDYVAYVYTWNDAYHGQNSLLLHFEKNLFFAVPSFYYNDKYSSR